MKTLKILSIAGCFILLPILTQAWGMLGHRIVGEVAQQYLSQRAKKEIKKILGNETLAMSSNWLDFVKSDTTYNYFYNWHFINLRQGLSDQEVLGYLATDTIVDAYTKLNFLSENLKNKNLPIEIKRMYLRALVHIAGDVNQPMHVGRRDDQGGNKVKLSWFNEPTNLHHVWDDDLIASQKMSYTEYVAAINFTTLDQLREWQAQPMAQWILDSYKLANKIYEGVKADDKLSYRYIYDYIEIANLCLLRGGVRLAGLLNAIYK